VKRSINPKFGISQLSAVDIATQLAKQGALNHFKELTGEQASSSPINALSPHWQNFFDNIGQHGIENLNFKEQDLRKSVQENGITYNIYADQNGPQRPWSLDLFPLILTSVDWQQIEMGITQRASLLEKIMQDTYGSQSLIKGGFIPPALVQGHPGYLRQMHDSHLLNGNHLYLMAFDLAKGPNGNWSVISQRTQAPSGLGYLLENRNLVSQQFPAAYEKLEIEPLADTYREFIDTLKLSSPAGMNANIVLLTPGPYNETYFEHAYLARYLGLTLVEGGDLTVRNQRVYLRTVSGLEEVHIILKRLDDAFLDPLELFPESTLGVPGILQAIRSGNVLIANAPGSAFLESPAILGFLPGICENLLEQKLLLPAMDTWWCGESAALQSALHHLRNIALKPTYPSIDGHQSFPGTLTQYLEEHDLQHWVQKIHEQPNEYTVQQYIPLAQMPTWQNSSIVQKSYVLRVFSLRNGPNSWKILPGGLVRIASNDDGIASMQRGGSSADTWVCGYKPEKEPLLNPLYSPSNISQKRRVVTSRAAENLFWFGRYSERSENTVRLTRLYLKSLSNEYPANSVIWTWFEKICKFHNLVPADTPSNFNANNDFDRTFEKKLIESLHVNAKVTSVGFNLQGMQNAASSVRERLATDQWTIVQSCVKNFKADMNRATLYQEYSSNLAIEALNHANNALAAITGGQIDRMTRDDGWQLLSIGRHIERLFFFSSIMQEAIDFGIFNDVGVFGFDAILHLFDSTITYHSQHQQSRDLHALVDLIIADEDNPRSFAWIIQEILKRIEKLNSTGKNPIVITNMHSLKTKMTNIDHLCQLNKNQELDNLKQCIHEINQSVINVTESINATYFNHIYRTDYRI
jgi:uncharacterized circularly permuted ATP-grasp superfamily protein/uncharacterized alpha-E superfamily protein